MIETMRRGIVCVSLLLPVSPAIAGSVASPNWNIPNKDVVLHCAPPSYKIHCSISRMANPEYSSSCFYVDGEGRSHRMKPDYRFGFTNPIVALKVTNGLRITADLTDLRSGAHARCAE